MKRRECKRVLEQHYKVPFRRSAINNLSIDFYNSSLMVGLQYNSIHHYKYSPKFHKTYKSFKDIQTKDAFRKQMCIEAGIRLICIPCNSACVSGQLSRILKFPNNCRCYDCLNIARLSRPSRAGVL